MVYILCRKVVNFFFKSFLHIILTFLGLLSILCTSELIKVFCCGIRIR